MSQGSSYLNTSHTQQYAEQCSTLKKNMYFLVDVATSSMISHWHLTSRPPTHKQCRPPQPPLLPTLTTRHHRHHHQGKIQQTNHFIITLSVFLAKLPSIHPCSPDILTPQRFRAPLCGWPAHAHPYVHRGCRINFHHRSTWPHHNEMRHTVWSDICCSKIYWDEHIQGFRGKASSFSLILSGTGLQFYDAFRYVRFSGSCFKTLNQVMYAGNRKNLPNTHAKTFAMFKIMNMNMTVPVPGNM